MPVIVDQPITSSFVRSIDRSWVVQLRCDAMQTPQSNPSCCNFSSSVLGAVDFFSRRSRSCNARVTSALEVPPLFNLSRRTALSFDRCNPSLMLSTLRWNSSIPQKEPSRSSSHDALMTEYVIPCDRKMKKEKVLLRARVCVRERTSRPNEKTK